MSKNKIQNSINSVEPELGAKERMYRNITNKAQQSAPAESAKKPVSIVRYALPIAACLCLIILGAARLIPESAPTAPDNSGLQIANPYTQVDSAEDFKSISISLLVPADAQDIRYGIIGNEIADVQFELGGESYTLRASTQSGDFSGLNGSEETIETVDAAQNAVLFAVKIDASQVYKITWTSGKANYCLYATADTSIEQLKSVYEQIA